MTHAKKPKVSDEEDQELIDQFTEFLCQHHATEAQDKDAFDTYARELIDRFHKGDSFKNRFVDGYHHLLEELQSSKLD